MASRVNKATPVSDERGMTLVEILVAITIMSIISVSIMSHFVSAAQRSADESRRIIAANLARLKLAEWREMGKQSNLDPSKSNYRLLLESFPSSGTILEFTADSPLPAPFSGDAVYSQLLQPQLINGSVYEYRVTLEREATPDSRRAKLNDELASMNGADAYLLRLTMRVSWRSGVAGASPAGSSILDSYLVEPR